MWDVEGVDYTDVHHEVFNIPNGFTIVRLHGLLAPSTRRSARPPQTNPDRPQVQYLTTGQLSESEAFRFSKVETLLFLNATSVRVICNCPSLIRQSAPCVVVEKTAEAESTRKCRLHQLQRRILREWLLFDPKAFHSTRNAVDLNLCPLGKPWICI